MTSSPGGAARAVMAREPKSLPALETAVDRATEYLLAQQAPEGYWVGRLEADITLEADYILLQLFLYPPAEDGSWNPPMKTRVERAARSILRHQLPNGGWSIYAGGPANVSASVKAYCALKMAGMRSHDPHLESARECILELGGVEAANSYTKLYLSYFELCDRRMTPSIPVELFLLPETAPINIYEMSSWSRAILGPLAVLGSLRPRKRVPRGCTVDEIFSGAKPAKPPTFSWRNFFLWVDRALKVWERVNVPAVRRKALRAAADWIKQHLEDSDGLGAIFPGQLNCIMALHELGHGLDDPLLRREIERFNRLVVEEDDVTRLQPCLSPVWDTALTCYAIGSAHAAPDAHVRQALERGGAWLVSKEVRQYGDWAVKNKNVEPGGWYFEFSNEFYPDTDDTAKVLLSMQYARAADQHEQQATEERALRWLLSMQSKDGGWGAFDVDNDCQILTQVPFADHNSMLDPTCADITGRVLEAVALFGIKGSHPAARRAVEYLKSTQEQDGSWYGRWGVNYIYGTCFALRGIEAAGESPRQSYIARARRWIESVQNADGGWGESCASYEDPTTKGQGESTPSQTAWAVLGLIAAGDLDSAAVETGIRYLLDHQNPDGSWSEELFTGTGFPRVFYLRYHLYPQYFPLMALGRYRAVRDASGREGRNGAESGVPAFGVPGPNGSTTNGAERNGSAPAVSSNGRVAQ